jgi:hypothetical protein
MTTTDELKDGNPEPDWDLIKQSTVNARNQRTNFQAKQGS